MTANTDNSRTKNFADYLFWIFIFVYFVVLIYLASRLNIWEDESYSLDTSSNSLPEVLKLSYDFEGQPPFYFLILALWRMLNSSIFFARLLSVVFIALSAILFKKVAAYISGKENSRWITIVFLLNPLTVWAAMEIRLYALVILLSLLCIFYFIKFYSENKKKYLLLFLLTSLIGLYTQYFLIFLLIALAVSLWITRGWKASFQFCLYLIPVGLLFLPNFLFVPDQIVMIKSHLKDYTLFKKVTNVLQTPQNFLMSMGLIPLEQIWRRLIKIILILLFAYAYLKAYQRRNTEGIFFKRLNMNLLILLIIVFLFNVFVVSLDMIYQDKYMILALPLFILLFSVFSVFTQAKKNLIYAFFCFYFITILLMKYKSPTKIYDYQTAAEFINKIEQKQEPVLFYSKSILPAFKYYYAGKNPLSGLPPVNYTKEYYEERITDINSLEKEIQAVKSPTDSYLLVTGSLNGIKYEDGISYDSIQRYLQKDYEITLDTSFKNKYTNDALRVQRLMIKKQQAYQ